MDQTSEHPAARKPKIDITDAKTIRRMHKVSRFVMIAPVVILVLGILTSLYNRYQLTQAQQLQQQYIKISPSVSLTPKPTTVKLNSIKLDLKGPFTCQYSENQASLSAFIENREIAFVSRSATESSYMVVSGDCAYRWTDSSTEGLKVCGMKTYLDAAEAMAGFGLLSVDKAIETFSGMSDSPLATNEALMTQFANSCKKEAITGQPFTIPTTVTFTEEDIEQVTGTESKPAGEQTQNGGSPQELLKMLQNMQQ
jgi:hypothetical protein